MENLRLSTLIPENDLQEKVRELGKLLSERFQGQDLVAICVLKGSFMFYADLIRAIDTDVVCEFFGVSSYQNSTQSSGEVKLTLDLTNPVEGKNVILVEDIVDSGLTMEYLVKNIASRQPKSLTTVALLHKPEAKKVECQLDHVGFEIGNDFVVGYGLDYQGYFRNLPYVARIESLN